MDSQVLNIKYISPKPGDPWEYSYEYMSLDEKLAYIRRIRQLHWEYNIPMLEEYDEILLQKLKFLSKVKADLKRSRLKFFRSRCSQYGCADIIQHAWLNYKLRKNLKLLAHNAKHFKQLNLNHMVYLPPELIKIIQKFLF